MGLLVLITENGCAYAYLMYESGLKCD